MKDSQKTFTVTELTYHIKNLIETGFSRVAVEGEISNFKISYTGHAYFTLKDQFSELSAVMFKSKLELVKNPLLNGTKIIAFGKIIVYEQRGVYQINIDRIQAAGAGLLQLKFEELKKKLFERGWFSEERKRDIIQYPNNIGIITSPTGAAIQDILNVIKRRYPKVKINLYPVSVQGESAKYEIAEAFSYFNKRHQTIDTIILARGGGSIEDLWAFNEEMVAEAVFNSKIPVITGIGHEIDFTIADFVSDLRAPTPSAAAEMAVPDINETYQMLSGLKKDFNRDIITKVKYFRQQINAVKNSRAFSKPFEKIELKKILLDELQLRLKNNLSGKTILFRRIIANYDFTKILLNRIKINKEKILRLNNNFLHLNPLNILDRGYAAVFNKNGNAVTEVKSLSKGEKIDLRMKDGIAECEVLVFSQK